jgi:hypothetical protein
MAFLLCLAQAAIGALQVLDRRSMRLAFETNGAKWMKFHDWPPEECPTVLFRIAHLIPSAAAVLASPFDEQEALFGFQSATPCFCRLYPQRIHADF